MDTTSSGASLSFEPTQQTVRSGEMIDLTINIFTDAEPVISTDVWITYDPTLVQPVLPIKNAGVFETAEAKIIAPGKLYLYALHRDPATAGTANGAITSVSFQTLQEGVARFSFECNLSGKSSSQIIRSDTSLTNIINCDRTIAHTSTTDITNAQVLGATDTIGGSLPMWYLSVAVVILILTTILYIRTRYANSNAQ